MFFLSHAMILIIFNIKSKNKLCIQRFIIEYLIFIKRNEKKRNYKQKKQKY
jgi:hypothetical protein